MAENVDGTVDLSGRKPSKKEAAQISRNLTDRGGRAENLADPETPTFMLKDQSNPNNLSKHQPSGEINKN